MERHESRVQDVSEGGRFLGGKGSAWRCRPVPLYALVDSFNLLAVSDWAREFVSRVVR